MPNRRRQENNGDYLTDRNATDTAYDTQEYTGIMVAWQRRGQLYEFLDLELQGNS